MENVVSSSATDPEILFDRSLTDSVLQGVTIDSVDPGWLGAFSEGSAPPCDTGRDRRWLTTTDASHSQDCDFSPGTSGPASVSCECTGGNWSVVTAEPQPGLVLADADAPSTVLVLRDVWVGNARDRPGVVLWGDVSEVEIMGLGGFDTSPATVTPQRSALALLDGNVGVRLENLQCWYTDPSMPCLEYLRDPGDWDGDSVPNASDNCIEVANPTQQDLDGDGIGDVCDVDADADGLLDIYETGTGIYVGSPSVSVGRLVGRFGVLRASDGG